MKKICVLVLILSIVAGSVTLYGQEKKSRKQRKAEQTEMKIKQLIEAQDYTFICPSIYMLVITKEGVRGVLSFFGPSRYSIDEKGGNVYSSTDFDYRVESAEKNGWDIYIKTAEYHMLLNVSSNGSALLHVPYQHGMLTNRIFGYVQKSPKKGLTSGL